MKYKMGTGDFVQTINGKVCAEAFAGPSCYIVKLYDGYGKVDEIIRTVDRIKAEAECDAWKRFIAEWNHK